MNNIESIPKAYKFMFRLYEEVASLFEEVEGQLKDHGISGMGARSYYESLSKQLGHPEWWLPWAPSRFYRKGKKTEILIHIKCVLNNPSPHVIVGIYRFLKPRGKFDLGDWYGVLAPEYLEDAFEIEEKGGISKARLKDENDEKWKGDELKDFRFFQIPLVELKNSSAVKEKICDPILKILKK